MRITETKVRGLEITGVPGLDPIRVTLEDLGPGQGRINIECYSKAWATCWGGMGKDTIAQFVTGCDEHYIAGKVSSTPSQIFDPEGLVEMLKREVVENRRKGLLTHEEARYRFNDIEELDLPDDVNAMFHVAGIEELMGPEWWYRLPKKENPDYAYMIRIIKTVQAALKTIQEAAL